MTGVLQSQELEKDFVMINKNLEWFVYQDLIKVKNPYVGFVDIITLLRVMSQWQCNLTVPKVCRFFCGTGE